MKKAGRKQLLTHLFASVKAKQDGLTLGDDLAKADFINASRMPVQQAVAMDMARRISVRCPRRAGKSWLVLSIALERCLRKRGSVWVVLGLARPSVKQIFWSLLKQLNTQLELGLHFLETDLVAEFPNGSKMLFRGAETRSEIEKLRGGQYDGVIIDECKSFAPVIFTELVQDVIEPALNDRRGVLILVGTPGDILAGPFYEATCEPPIEFKGGDGIARHTNHLYGSPASLPFIWSMHTWTLRDNVECPWLWDEALQTKNIRGWSDDNATWRREYLGHWVASNVRLVYRYVPRYNDYDGNLPDGYKWVYVLGLDPGYRDADAIVVWAYSRNSYDVYQVYGEKRSKQNITELANWLREIRDKYCGDYGPEVMTYDPAGGGAKIIAELATIHHLYFTEPADKKDKAAFIELMNNEFDAKRLHILPNERPDDYAAELMTNRWLEKTLGTAKRLEDPKTPNDLCDAGLYAWRVCDHRRPTPPDRKLQPSTPEWWKAYKDATLAEAIKQNEARKYKEDDYSHQDKDWWSHKEWNTSGYF